MNEIDLGNGPLGWFHDVFKWPYHGVEIKVIVEKGLAETLVVRVRGKLPTVWGNFLKRKI